MRLRDSFSLMCLARLRRRCCGLRRRQDDIRVSATALQASLVDHLCAVWKEPDEGIWETRGGRQHFTHSKVMAWVALDRAIRYHERFDGGGDIKRWKRERDRIHREVCEKGFNKRLNSFVQSYGSTGAGCFLSANCAGGIFAAGVIRGFAGRWRRLRSI